MKLIKKRNNCLCNPFKELDDLHKEMDTLFGLSFPSLFVNDNAVMSGSWVPAIDIHEDEKDIVVKADLPGLNKKDIQVSISGDVLSIKGEKKKDSNIKNENYCRAERYYGSFQRNIRIPTEVNTDKVKANFKDGVLELVLPKTGQSKMKKIDIL